MAQIKRSERLKVVVGMAERAEAQSARVLEQAQTNYVNENKKFEELQEYYTSYELQFSQRTISVRASELNHSRAFLQRLKDAETAQSIQVETARRVEQECKRQWQLLHLKKEKLMDFVDRCKNDEQELLDKAEQKLMDEWVSLLSRTH